MIASRTLVLSAALLAMASASAADGGAGADARFETSALNASRAQVAAACAAHGGSSYGTGDSRGSYGCIRADGAYLDCDVNGLCEGGMPAKRQADGGRGAAETAGAQQLYGR